MELTSSAFENGGLIPSLYTCEGKNVNPPLKIRGAPKGAKSFVLLVDDPDVPASVRSDQMWDHWVVYDILPDATEIAEHSKPGTEGKSTSGRVGYEGPCPPDREHRYFFKLYALDRMLGLPPGMTKKEVEETMAKHTLAKATLMGRYDKRRR